jgi:Tetratricopeptide repeat
VVVLSREAFDAIEFDAACSGEHRAAAQQMTWLADTGTQTVAMPRSEAYVRAGEQWLLADDPVAAVHGFNRALADGGPSSVDPRIPLARALFQLGRTEEAEEHIRKLGSHPPRDARMCDLLAELLVEQSDLPAALAWATAGVALCLGQTPGPVATGTGGPDGTDARASARTPVGGGASVSVGPGLAGRLGQLTQADQNELRLLLSLRFRIRNDLGMPEDDYDRLIDDLQLPRNGGL